MAKTGPTPISSGWQPAVAKATKRASGLMPERLRALGRHHHGGRRAVRHLRGIARRHRALRVERRLQRGQRFQRGVGARPSSTLNIDLRRASSLRRPRPAR